MDSGVSISKPKGMRLPRLPFALLGEEILGKTYDLSIALVDKKKSREINKKYRGKDKPTNVLSFPLSKKKGELVLCPDLIKEESRNPEKNFGKNFRELFGFLVIHGMLHLKGMSHSSRMEKAEIYYVQKHFSRNRRGVNKNSRGSRGISKRRKKS
jgi:rRNA maturation RNase YbeY